MTVLIGDERYMAFLANCRERGIGGANYEIAEALTQLADTESRLETAKRNNVYIHREWMKETARAETAERERDEALRQLAEERERGRVIREALSEIMDYRGGADSPLEDEYVVHRVNDALDSTAPDAPVSAEEQA